MLLKEDGSLDVERINKLPLEEYMDTVGDFTEEQYCEYLKKSPINESRSPMKVVYHNPKIEEECEINECSNADTFLNEMREKNRRRLHE